MSLMINGMDMPKYKIVDNAVANMFGSKQFTISETPTPHRSGGLSMNDFLLFVDNLKKRFPIHVEITYDKHSDWVIYIYRKGLAKDYPNAIHDGDDVVLVREYDCDMELCFAKAHVALKEWLLEFNGGY